MVTAAFWSALGSLVSTGISLIADIAILIVALTTVRRRCASAGMWMSGAAGLWMVLTLLSTVAYSGATFLVSHAASGGPEAIVGAHVLVGIALTVLRTGGWALMLIGVVQLANIPATDGAAPLGTAAAPLPPQR